MSTKEIAIKEDFKFLLSRKVTKDNRLINAQAPLTARQYLIFTACLATLPYDCEEFNDTEITINQILGKERLNSSDYAHTKESAIGLSESSLKIQIEKKWKAVPLFSYIEGEDDTNIIRFKLNQELKPFLLNLKEKGNFTSFKYGYNTFLKKSFYAMRLYEMLKQHINFGKRSFAIEELREIFFIGDRYSAFKEFKRNVIVPSVDLVNKTDLVVGIEYIKRGRSISHVEFSITNRYPDVV